MMICPACHSHMDPVVDGKSRSQRCPECGHLEGCEAFPLFIITGTSGTGKTAILPDLRGLLPDWDIFETDVLWFGSGSWGRVWESWLRVAYSLSMSRRPVILAGTVLPEGLDQHADRRFFDPVHYLALHCNDVAREARLRARPAWREWTDEKIAEHQGFAQWLLDHAETEFDPPLTIVDTSSGTTLEAAEAVRDWALHGWNTWVEERERRDLP